MKYSLSPRDFSKAHAIFYSISRLELKYRHSHLANNGPAAVVAHAAVTAVAGNLNIAVAVKWIASVEAVLAAMLTCSHSTSHSHSHYINHPSIHPSVYHPFIDSSIHPSIQPSKIAFFLHG